MDNFTSLTAALQELGFDNDPDIFRQLRDAIDRRLTELTLTMSVYFDFKLEATLFITRHPSSDQLILEKYDATIHNTVGAMSRTAQRFRPIFSVREAYNLMQGRAVYKATSGFAGRYMAWYKLNVDQQDAYGMSKFRQFGPGYGYDLERTLSLYPVEDLENTTTKAALIKSLKQGDIQPVILRRRSKRERIRICANPEAKTITIYPMNRAVVPAMNDSN